MTEKSEFNIFPTHLKKRTPLVNYPTTSNNEKMASWPLLEPLLPTCLFVAGGWLRLKTVLENSCDWTMLFFYKTCVTCKKT